VNTNFFAGVIATVMATSVAVPALSDALPSWSEGDNRDAIIAFVESVTQEGTETYLDPEDRIAVFDNDGTLWTEKPTYTEVIFAFEQVKALAPNHPEWQEQEPFAQILENGLGALKEIGLKGAITALTAVYAELDDAEFAQRAADFLDDPHLSAGRAYQDTTYAPMVEMVEYLRDNGFEIFIVSGGTNDFLRSFAETAYGVPPQRIIGSALETEVIVDDSGVSLKQLPNLAYFNDGPTKVLNIVNRLGIHPTIVVGNSDGDLPMIQYALAGAGPKLAVLVNHDDDAREAAYDRGAEAAIAAAAPDGDNFLLVSMKNDFAAVWNQ
jgi:phosphoglycolate phosphatase-like HAD superfamily hydrolase